MLYELLRLVFAFILSLFRFFGTALGISRLIQLRQMHRLHDQAAAMGFHTRRFSKKWDSAELAGEFSGIKVLVQTQFGGSSRTGTFVSARLKGNPRRLKLENGLFNYFLTFVAYKGDYYPRFSTGHTGFDTTFLMRFADEKTAKTLTESKNLLDEITRFYRTWVLFTHSFSIDNTGEDLKIEIRLTYGYSFNPYIRPEILREVVDGLVRIAGLWKRAFGSKLSDAEKRLAGLLLNFADKGDVSKVKQLLDQGASVHFENNDHETALHLGAGSRNIEIVRLLLAAGADPNARDQVGRTPLFRIIANPTNPDLLNLLLDSGVDVNITDSLGETVLFQAAMWDDVPTVRILINHGINVTLANLEGKTAWYFTKPETESRRLIEEAGGGPGER